MRKIIGIAAPAIAATPVLAHHPLGALPMKTFTRGLLSGAGRLVVHVLNASSAAHVNARLIGAMVAGAGAFLALEMIEGPVLALITG